MGTVGQTPSVPAIGRARGSQLARALVTEKVVARDDVIHLQALRASEPFADVALEQALVVHDIDAPVVAEQALGGDPAAGLTVSRQFHNDLARLFHGLRCPRGAERGSVKRVHGPTLSRSGGAGVLDVPLTLPAGSAKTSAGGLAAPGALPPALPAVAPVMQASRNATVLRTDAQSGPIASGSLSPAPTGCGRGARSSSDARYSESASSTCRSRFPRRPPKRRRGSRRSTCFTSGPPGRSARHVGESGCYGTTNGRRVRSNRLRQPLLGRNRLLGSRSVKRSDAPRL
jgi:hypothetical protein